MTPEQRPEPSRLRPRTPRRPELRVFAERLPRFRKAWDSRHPYEPPMTQERLAERMEVDARTVREWERGRCAPRTFERAMQLGEVLDVSLEELGLSSSAMTAGRRSDRMAEDARSPMTTRVIDDLVWATRAVLAPQLPERASPMLYEAGMLESGDRDRCWVDGMLGITEGMKHLVLGTQHAGSAETVAVEQSREIVGMCRRLDDMGMSATVLQVGRRALARVDELVRDCTSMAARRPLTLLAGELSQILGHAAAGLHDGETAKRFTDRAITAADEAGSADLRTYAMSLNLVSAELHRRSHCDPAATATAATAAHAWARRSGNPAVVSQAHSVVALVQARAGREAATLRALDEAERYLERSTPEECPSWLYWYDHTVLLGRRGECLLELCRARRPGAAKIDETVTALRGALAARGRGYPRSRALCHLDLADAYWGHGEREESIRHASYALVLAAGMEWRCIRERLEEVHRLMVGDPLPAARDFSEHFHALLRS